MIKKYDGLFLEVSVAGKPELMNIPHRFICLDSSNGTKEFSNVTSNAMRLMQKPSFNIDGLIMLPKNDFPELKLERNSYLVINERYLINNQIDEKRIISSSPQLKFFLAGKLNRLSIDSLIVSSYNFKKFK